MKNKLYTAFRILIAIVFIPSAFISFFINPDEMGLSYEAVEVVENLWATGYIMQVVKSIELIAGIMFLTNRFIRLACVLIMPVIINIVLLAIFKDPQGLITSLPILAMILFIVKENWTSYKILLVKTDLV